GVGVGKIALASMLGGGMSRLLSSVAYASPTTNPTTSPTTRPIPRGPSAAKPSHFPARAKHVIYLFMAGAPSQLDLFDNKPLLVKHDGKPVPEEFVKDQRYAFIEKNAALMSSRYKFAKHGQSGQELSEMLPHLAKVADDIAIVRSMHTEQ